MGGRRLNEQNHSLHYKLDEKTLFPQSSYTIVIPV